MGRESEKKYITEPRGSIRKKKNSSEPTCIVIFIVNIRLLCNRKERSGEKEKKTR